MRIVAILKNNEHLEYGEVSIPLPIKTTEYGRSMDLLSSLGIGDALRKDCQVAEFTRAYPTLRCLEGCKVNIDELDYLAKRLDGFDAVEITQFQAMADKLKLTDMKDLINLTFSCQQTTVIADFSDLESVGRAQYMNTHGGCASAEELDNLDGEETAILLIEDNEGTITRYGVVYDNGMQLSQLYDGKNLPCYHHENDCIHCAGAEKCTGSLCWAKGIGGEHSMSFKEKCGIGEGRYGTVTKWWTGNDGSGCPYSPLRRFEPENIIGGEHRGLL